MQMINKHKVNQMLQNGFAYIVGLQTYGARSRRR